MKLSYKEFRDIALEVTREIDMSHAVNPLNRDSSVKIWYEPEFSFGFIGDPRKYMIIMFADKVSFQRYGKPEEQTGEIWFHSLDELYNAETIDGICLKRDWDRIDHIIADSRYDLFDKDEREKYLRGCFPLGGQ